MKLTIRVRDNEPDGFRVTYEYDVETFDQALDHIRDRVFHHSYAFTTVGTIHDNPALDWSASFKPYDTGLVVRTQSKSNPEIIKLTKVRISE